MARYFFHLHDGTDCPDLAGTELPSLAAARTHGVLFMAEMLLERRETFWNGKDWTLKVSDDAGLVLFILIFCAVDAPAIASH